VLTRENVALLKGDALRGPCSLDGVVVLFMVRLRQVFENRAGSARTSLLEMGTESWTMLPIILTLALRSFSFSAAEARRSFFSFSRSAETCQHL
jgi:hypothetical protein